MQIKTYTDRDLTSALARAQSELGTDALVLGTRDFRDGEGRPRVEIRVGVERPRVDLSARSALLRVARAVESRRASGAKPEPPVAVTAPSTPPAPTPAPSPAPTPSLAPSVAGPSLDAAVASLVQSGLSRDLATRFGRIAAQTLQQDAGQIARAAEAGIAALLPFGDVPTAARVIFVVGPPGAGKTTTVAKLVARLVAGSTRPVVFAEADAERVGALPEAEIYARHAGAELSMIEDVAGLKRTLKLAERRARVVIDTCGVGTADTGRMAALTQMRDAARDAQVVLLLPAGLHHEEARRVLDRFAPLRPTSVAFSKVDDGRRIGELVTALSGADLPLSFTTHGHRIPDDLEAATPRRLAALMLRAGRPQKTQSGAI